MSRAGTVTEPGRRRTIDVVTLDSLGAEDPVSDEITSPSEARGPLVMEAEHLAKNFKLSHTQTLSAVRDVSFGLYQSAVVALVGESGSGKSTVARLLAGQEQPSSGVVRLDGDEVHVRRASAFRAYKRRVQMVFQDPFASLNPVHTVRYHLKRPVRLRGEARGRPAEGEALSSLLEQVRLTPAEQYLAKYPHELSGGQRQRVAIARALATAPRVLLADEPVSMLDVSIRLEILNLLDGLRERFQLAVLYITHDIASARYFADETLVMYAGSIVERGPSEDLTQRPAHPYTQLLVASAADPDALGSTLRNGTVRPTRAAASALLSGEGCSFAPRCPLAEDRCRRVRPPLVKVGPQRAAACWRVDVALRDTGHGAEKPRPQSGGRGQTA